MMETIDSTNWGLLSLVADLLRRTSPQPGRLRFFTVPTEGDK
jgi:hypothetical protein